jgi:tetratricopeptide (TPR) repeat protein
LAEYYLRRGEFSEALDQTNQVLSQYPEHEGALLASGVIHVRLDQPETALDSLERFVELRKDKPMAGTDTVLETAYYFLGESYVKLNRPTEAISALEAALVINPADADALYQLGLAYQASSQPEVALKYYHQAVRFVPNFTEAYNSMIESYSILEQPDYVVYAGGMQAFCLQDYETAQIYLESAAQALPDFAPAFLGLGLAREKVGELQAALTAIQRALELDPGNYAAQHAHGRIQAALNSQD